MPETVRPAKGLVRVKLLIVAFPETVRVSVSTFWGLRVTIGTPWVLEGGSCKTGA